MSIGEFLNQKFILKTMKKFVEKEGKQEEKFPIKKTNVLEAVIKKKK